MIDKILSGENVQLAGSLDFSCTKIELALDEGDVATYTLEINGDENVIGDITVKDFRIKCSPTSFSGSRTVITVTCDGTNLYAGETLKGNINLISNVGEYTIPYNINITHQTLESSIGTVKNLFHFANLAKSNWTEAVKLFYIDEFIDILKGNDAKYIGAYKGLCNSKGNEQNVEEFLIHINKKSKIEYSLETYEINVNYSVVDELSPEEYGIIVQKNGWGCTFLNVEKDGDFIFLPKESISDIDFLGNKARLPIYIDPAKLRRGKNFGKIYLFNSYVSMEVDVKVEVGDTVENMKLYEMRKKKYDLMKLYQDFRLKKITTSLWLSDTDKIVQELIDEDPDNVEARLFKAQLLITEERPNEAGWILDHVGQAIDSEKDYRLYAYYKYLTTLIRHNNVYINEVAEEVHNLFLQYPKDWRLAWLLMFLKEEYTKNPYEKWAILEEQFNYDCTSPIMFIEAVNLVNASPSIIRKLDRFELEVLYFGTKHQVFSVDVYDQILYHVERTHLCSKPLLRILLKMYENYNTDRVLTQIITFFIRQGKKGKKYFEWYKLGVMQNLRITNIYEYYMNSIDLDGNEEIPKVVLMYFSYKTNLDFEQSAYLYAYILHHEEELAELYSIYRPRIEAFVDEQIRSVHINANLSFLYTKLLNINYINDMNAPSLAKLLFANKIVVKDDRIKKTYVYQNGNTVLSEYDLVNCSTWIPLYGNDYTIIFEDEFENRFIDTVSYSLEKYPLPERFIRTVAEIEKKSLPLNLYLCEYEREELTKSNVERVLAVTQNKFVEKRIKQDKYLQLMQYYYDCDDNDALDAFLDSIPLDELDNEERKNVIRYMVLRGKTDKAYGWFEKYGPYCMDEKVLNRLISVTLESHGMGKDPLLLAACVHAFGNSKLDEDIIKYLDLYFEGSLREMRDIRNAAKDLGIPVVNLQERMIVQMLFTGAFVGEKMDIFKDYVDQGGRNRVIEAFLNRCAVDSFVYERVIDKVVFDEMEKRFDTKNDPNLICRLAYLKFYAENKNEILDTQKFFIEKLLNEMFAKGIHLNFFKDFEDISQDVCELQDKLIIEYRTGHNIETNIHYCISREENGLGEYMNEPMTKVCDGVFFKEFTLFFGENLQYYIVESDGNEEQLTSSSCVQNSDIKGEDVLTKYDFINEMIIAKTLQDFDTVDINIEDFIKKKYVCDEIFKPL